MIAEKQYEDIRFSGYYNVGPDDVDCVTTGTLTDIFCELWGEGQSWENQWDVSHCHTAILSFLIFALLHPAHIPASALP